MPGLDRNCGTVSGDFAELPIVDLLDTSMPDVIHAILPIGYSLM
jgi:hypothetical protein